MEPMTVPAARVLVVDDEDAITDLVSTALRYTGFDVAVASTGRAAIATAATFRPELIVLDIMLPDLDGFEVTRRLRGDGVRVPVVFLTARDATEDKVAGLTIGGDDYVTKPFSLEELVARVRAVLRRTPRRRRRLRPPAVQRSRARRGHARGVARRDVGRTHRRPSSSCSATSCSTPAGCSQRPRSSTMSGSTTSAATPTSSRRTSATCARRSTSSSPALIHTVRGVGYTLRLPELTDVAAWPPAGRPRARLVMVGLLAADVATYTALRSFLTDRIDQQLDDTVVRRGRELAVQSHFSEHGPPRRTVIPSGTDARLLRRRRPSRRAPLGGFRDDPRAPAARSAGVQQRQRSTPDAPA